jgi:acyl transferase domain-containing protein
MEHVTKNIPEPIAIVGTSCRFAGGSDSPSKLWELLKNPVDLSKEIPSSRFNTTGFYHKNAELSGVSGTAQLVA